MLSLSRFNFNLSIFFAITSSEELLVKKTPSTLVSEPILISFSFALILRIFAISKIFFLVTPGRIFFSKVGCKYFYF